MRGATIDKIVLASGAASGTSQETAAVLAREATKTVAWLLTDRPSFLAGQSIVIDCGRMPTSIAPAEWKGLGVS